MTKQKIIPALVAVVALVVVAFFSSGIFEKEDTLVGGYPTKEFHSQYGFTLQYPADWIVDDSQKDTPAEFIREPHGRAFYSMQAHIDPRLTDPNELASVYRDLENSFVNDEKYLVEESGWEYEDKTTADNSYFAAGSYEEGGKHWRFKEITIMSKSGNVLVLRGMLLKEYAGEYGQMTDQIFASVVPTEKKVTGAPAPKVAQTEALAKVQNLPEVQEYQQMLAMAGKKVTTEVEDGDSEWSVHVFEIVKEADGSSHTATFGWYSVDKKTGVVKKEL